MDTYKHILAPIDFSAGSEQGLAHALAMARRYEAALHVLHVSDREHESTLDFPLMDELFNAVKAVAARLHPHEHAEGGMTRPRLRCAVRAHRDVARGILEYAAEYGVDLIVASPYGHRRDGHFRLGRTAEKLARLSSCDVLTTGRHIAFQPGQVRRILVPVDFSPLSSVALERARKIGHVFDAHVTLIHVQAASLYPHGSRGTSSIDVGSKSAATEEDLMKLYRYGKGPDVAHSFVVQRGDPAVAVAAYADRHDIHLIVQGSRGLSGIDYAMLGSVAESVVREATCPVLTVKAATHDLASSVDAKARATQESSVREYVLSTSDPLK